MANIHLKICHIGGYPIALKPQNHLPQLKKDKKNGWNKFQPFNTFT